MPPPFGSPQHTQGPRVGGHDDRDRRLGRASGVPPRRERRAHRPRSSSPSTATAASLVRASDSKVSNRRRRCPSTRSGARSRSSFPTRVWNPGERKIRLAAGVGLWNKATGRYLRPGRARHRRRPGGAAGLSDPAAFFNVAFRFDEPWQHTFPPDTRVQRPGLVARPPAGQRARRRTTCSAFFAKVDFAKLAAGVTDDQYGKPGGVPRSGPDGPDPRQPLRDRAGRRLLDHLRQPQRLPGRAPWTAPALCDLRPQEAHARRRLRTDPAAALARRELQPVRRQPQPVAARRARAGIDRDHARGSRPGRLVLRPRGRRHLRGLGRRRQRRYRLDPRWTAISGYSMGGYGTYKFATQYPDLFARANPVVGPPGLGVWVPPSPPQPGGDASNTNRMLASVRQHPLPDLERKRGRAGPSRRRGRRRRRRSTTSAIATGSTCSRPRTTSRSPSTTSTRRPRTSSAHSEVNRNPPTSPTSSTRPWTSPPPARSPTTPTGSRGSKLRDRGGNAPLGQVDARSEGFGLDRPGAEPDPDLPRDARGRQSRPHALQRAPKSWGPAPAPPTTRRAPPRRPEPGPGRRAPRPRPPQLPRAARRHHRRAADPEARGLRPTLTSAAASLSRRGRAARLASLAARRWTSSSPPARGSGWRSPPAPSAAPPGAAGWSASCSPPRRRSAAASCSGPRWPPATTPPGRAGRWGR